MRTRRGRGQCLSGAERERGESLPALPPGYAHHGYCWAFGALQGGSRKCYMDPNQTTCGPRLLSLYRRFPTGAWPCRCMVATGKYASVGILLCSQPAREVKPSRRG